MRIDRINLIGDFRINGLAGESSQGIGYSGSSIYWISVTGSGGGGSVGPQGPTGPNFIHTTYSGVGLQVAIGDGNNGLTFSERFRYLHTASDNCRNLIISSDINSTTRFSTASTIIAGFSASNLNNFNSIIISSSSSTIYCSNFAFMNSSTRSAIRNGSHNSAVISSELARIVNSKNSSIIGGYDNTISSANGFDNNVILGGVSNRIYCGGASSIIGGGNNCNLGIYNVILGGSYNCAGTLTFSCNSVIIGGRNNCFVESAQNSAIIGGRNNCIAVSGVVGQAAIIGASGSTINGGDNCIVFQKLEVANFTKFDAYTNVSPSNGDLWFDTSTSKLMFRTNGNSYCIECS
jgi:hypothetical protein